MSEPLTPKIGTPTSVIPHPTFKAQDKTYWEVQFREEPPNGVSNVLSVMKGMLPPDIGKPILYTTTPIEHGGGPINKISWPVSPQLIPADVRQAYEKLRSAGVVEEMPGEVTQPIENPVVSTTVGVAAAPEKPYKAPDTDRKICRQAAMKAAVEYFAAVTNKPEQPMLAMKLMAESWEEWIYRTTN
jgi:hypothetical protein